MKTIDLRLRALESARRHHTKPQDSALMQAVLTSGAGRVILRGGTADEAMQALSAEQLDAWGASRVRDVLVTAERLIREV